MTHSLFIKPTRMAMAGALLFAAATASQATIILDFGSVVTGGSPGGTPPWATLLITNNGTGQVDFTLTHNTSSSPGQYLTELNLSISSLPGDFATATPLHSKIDGLPTFGSDAFNDGGYKFDINIQFETSNANGGINRVKPGESVSWSFTGTGLDESHFLALATPSGDGTATFGAMLHLQGISGGLSSKLSPEAVPEPASMAVLGLGSLLLIRRRRK